MNPSAFHLHRHAATVRPHPATGTTHYAQAHNVGKATATHGANDLTPFGQGPVAHMGALRHTGQSYAEHVQPLLGLNVYYRYKAYA